MVLFIVFIGGIITTRSLLIYRNSIHLNSSFPERTDLTEVLQLFFDLVSKGKFEEAVSRMDVEVARDHIKRTEYETALRAINKIRIISAQETQKESWGINEAFFRIMFHVELKPEYIQTMWDNGENTKIVKLAKKGQMWRIAEIRSVF